MSNFVVGQVAGHQLAKVMEERLAKEEFLRADRAVRTAERTLDKVENEYLDVLELSRRVDGKE